MGAKTATIKNQITMLQLELVFHFAVIAISLVVFFLRITASNAIFEFFMSAIAKVVPLFCMLFSGVQIFKYFGLI